jgi:hypothetical protein
MHICIRRLKWLQTLEIVHVVRKIVLGLYVGLRFFDLTTLVFRICTDVSYELSASGHTIQQLSESGNIGLFFILFF